MTLLSETPKRRAMSDWLSPVASPAATSASRSLRPHSRAHCSTASSDGATTVRVACSSSSMCLRMAASRIGPASSMRRAASGPIGSRDSQPASFRQAERSRSGKSARPMAGITDAATCAAENTWSAMLSP